MSNAIQAGQTLSARSVCDYDCIFNCEVLARKGSFATVKFMGNEKRCKVRIDSDGREFLMPVNYSMAPVFRAN